MDALTEAETAVLSTALLAWWERHGRGGIPWKQLPGGARPAPEQDLDPYGIWIAEVMLQQTQLQVVLPYWQRWMQSFPTLQALAAADEQAVLLRWQGLGYYSRALRLHATARLLLAPIDGDPTDPARWPQDLDAWLALPGVGRITAG